MLKFNKIKADSEDSYAMVMFHGHGGNLDSFLPLLNLFNFKEQISFYFLEAPYLLNKNSYSWSYEIKPGVWEREEPKKLLNNFFNNNIFSNYYSSKIFLLGFSQGAFICFEYGLNLDSKIGGVFPIAGFTSKTPLINQCQINTPLIIGHGINDNVIDISSSQKAFLHYSKIKKMNNVKLITYKGGHKIGLKYLKELNHFMNMNNIK